MKTPEQPISIDRPPRIQPELPFEQIAIPKPPTKQEDLQARLIQIGLPMVTIIGYVLVAVLAGSGRNPWFMLPMALAVLASTAFSFYYFRRERRRQAAIEQAYADRLVELNKEMQGYHEMQRRYYSYNYPDVPGVLRLVEQSHTTATKSNRTLRSEARLWERRASDVDFGVVRLGMGTLPSTVRYVLGDAENFDDPQVRAALKLADDSRYVADIPVIITLRQPPEQADPEAEAQQDEEEQRTPFAHALAVAGKGASVYSFVRALISHAVVFHAPGDARLYVLASDQREWEWTKPLPHCQGGEQDRHLFFLNPDAQQTPTEEVDSTEGNALERYLEGLRRVLAQRKIRLQERDEREESSDPTLPFCLVVVDLLEATYDTKSPLHAIETDAAMAILIAEGARLGAAVLFLLPERSKAPSGCTAVIEIEETIPPSNSRIKQNQRITVFRYAETGVNTVRYVGTADLITEQAALLQLAQQLSRSQVREGPGANLPSTVPFLKLMGYADLHELRAATLQHWQESNVKARWLRVRMGLMAGDKPRTLIFSAKRDGVHGMVAGSSGMGKSELLIALICGLAINYDPSVLNFVLVDYKGGSAFQEFKDLPHCVDIITNRAADGVTRMFTAIEAELQRRQKLNVDTGTKDIIEYRRQGLHQTHHPYPFLFIIIDEFAEMITDRAEYRAQLETITRLGRAQGVSLILAAQRPSGVTDQMRANIKFRICLRVESPAESREMLRRADAHFLPTNVPGRGYLQVGNDEIELIQVTYAGDQYSDPRQARVIWPDRGGDATAQDQEPVTLYKAIIAALNTLATRQGIARQLAPWPSALPLRFSLLTTLISPDPDDTPITAPKYLPETALDQILLGQPRSATLRLNPALKRWLDDDCGWIEPLNWGQFALRPVVGLVDDPAAARQLPLLVDLPRGHVVLFGASGWGKTTFIRTLITSLVATHTPDHCHIYLLDLGGRNLSVLEELPHVGALITPDAEGYEERVRHLLRELEALIEQRKITLNNARVQDIYQYNQMQPQTPLPAIVVVIDNFVEFSETFGKQSDDGDSTLDQFIALARQSKPYGVHLLITVGQLGDLSNQLYSLFTERFTLKLADPSEYRMIVGGQVAEIGDLPGRGYTRIGLQPLAFQVALPIAAPQHAADPSAELQALEAFVQRVNTYIASAGRSFAPLRRVDALDKQVLLKQLLARQHNLALDADFVKQLAAQVQAQWQTSTQPHGSDWLSMMVGVGSGNHPRILKLESSAAGVHGMIAGGTGAGKSELLMTMIVDLALRYDPSILNFVLVDYKGGGAFQPFAQLPHCVDLITNLNKAAVRRVFTSLRAEMERRQTLNTETKVKDLVEYRHKGLHRTYKPYPHLVIIIDEYAEMITDNPEFGAELDRITRVGRSLGVHLILASQRPTGVSDQMRANIKLRICLRVEGVDTSREMLRRSDAAFLPTDTPGRGYVQIGNEQIELIQVAYTGEKYPFAPAAENGEQPRFYDVAVQLAQHLAHGQRQPPPWPPFLPAALEFGPTLNPAVKAWLNGCGAWPTLDWGNSVLRPVLGLLDDPANARQVPLELDLTKGHAVLFGASGWGKTTFLRALALSLASTHPPGALHLHVLDLGGRSLDMLEALPHVGTIITPDNRGYEEQVQQLWRELNDTLDERKRSFSAAGVATLLEYNRRHPTLAQPALVVLIDNIAELIETFGNPARQNEADNLLEAFVALARQGRTYGLHFVVTASRPNALSSKLYTLFTERYTLRLADAGEYSAVVGSTLHDGEEIAGRGYTRGPRHPLAFQIALVPGALDADGRVQGEAPQIREMGKQMQQVAQAQPYASPRKIGALLNTVAYPAMLARSFGFGFDTATILTELKAAAQQVWQRNATAEHANWLEVALGVISGDRDRVLHFEAKQDGVHGMVAGGTGSGKSELLMTLISGLALTYSPAILNFVLVDYKGGGAFKPFEQLPHCVDSVTNLNKSAVHRMFTAINAEIRRRQQLNADTQTKDIIDYRSKGYHLKGQPYPHLFIIIDEYAEMIEDNPDYRQQLDSITRVGRSLGVNLLLASQRPRGVSDQMRANIKLRICLRVEELDTSRELLRRPDAALLPNGMPGRGYVQVGNDHIELIQVAYTGENQTDNRPPRVEWPDRPATPAQSDADTPKFFNAVVMLARELTAGQMAPRLWPGFLPETLSLESTLPNGTVLLPTVGDWISGDFYPLWPGVNWQDGAMRATVGLVDDPAEAQQFPLVFDLSREHLALFGDTGAGKSSLLRTVLLSLAATHSPTELHAYVLDLGGRNFRSLDALPHLGALIHADDADFEERVQRLFDILTQQADIRQQLISEAGVTNLYELNARHPDRALPAILVLIDNFVALQEHYETLIDTVLLPLVRRASSVGISFVVAANVPNHLSSRLYNLFIKRVTLRQTNTDLYQDIVGRGAVELDDIAGRGYLRVEKRPLQFQAALAVGLFDAQGQARRSEADELRLITAAMQRCLQQRGGLPNPPDPIRILPELLPLATLLQAAPPAERRVQALLGQTANLQPVLLDLQRMGPHLAIFGPPLAGKTTLLQTWVLALAARYSPSQARIVLIDLQRKLFAERGQPHLARLPHVIAAIGDTDELADLVNRLEQEGQALAAQANAAPLFVVVDNFDEFSDDTDKLRLTVRLATVVRRHGRDGLHMLIAALPDSSSNDLRRQIMIANYGIGLRTAPAVNALLRGPLPPAGLTERELPPGRGYLVKAGQSTLLQVATPLPEAAPATDGDETERLTQALEQWVQQICARYPDQQARWSVPVAQAASPPVPAAPPPDPTLEILRERVQQIARLELEALKAGNGNGAHQFLFEQLVQPTIWNNKAALLEIAREFLRRKNGKVVEDEDGILLDLDIALRIKKTS